MALPTKAGPTLLKTTSRSVNGTPSSNAAGKINMLATECSNPMATKLMGETKKKTKNRELDQKPHEALHNLAE